ncbi:cytochrome c [Paenibacillus filicis]|uniref:Cytochrome c n=1 Tax=Paenibacillus filicis TaxID=669464 RepID=A0ABU9DSP5_9BACL
MKTRRRRKKTTACALLLAVSLLAAGCGSAGSDQGDDHPALPAGEVEKLYQANCLACHGQDLAGGVGPNLQQVGQRLTAARIAEQITSGGKQMPAFKKRLTEAETEGLAKWLASQPDG